MANRFYSGTSGGYGNQLMGLSKIIGEKKEQARVADEKQAELDRVEKIKAGALKAWETGDPDTIRGYMISNPEIASAVKSATDMKFPGDAKSTYTNALFSAATNPEKMPSIFEQLKMSYEVDGLDQQETARLEQFKALMDEDPKTAGEQVRVELALLADDETWGRLKDVDALNKAPKENRPTTVMGQFIKNNPEATEEDLITFTEQLATAKIDKGAAEYAPTTLTKLFDKMDDLPEDSPRRAAYQARIDKLTSDSNPELELVLAQRIVDGKLDFNKLSRRGGLKGRIAAVIAEIAPEFDLIKAEANIKYMTDAGNLKTIALIAGIQPLFDELIGKAKDLENGMIPIFNAGVNAWKLQTGDEKIVAFNNLRDDVIAETERVLLGSGVLSDSKYQRALHNLNSAQSPAQMGAAIQQMMLVVQKREEALKSQPYPQGDPSKSIGDMTDDELLNTLNNGG